MLWIIPVLIVLFIAFMAWASYPWRINQKVLHTEIITIEPDEMMEVNEHPSVIKVLTFNLGFLYGVGSEGQGYEAKDPSYYQERLDKLIVQLKDWNADVLCLQEVDFDAKRSGHVNQAEYIAKHAGYPYLGEAYSWDLNYIPFPYWPPRNHFGKIKSGGVILSKYPLHDHEVTLLQKPHSKPWWYNLFYLHRYVQKVTVTIGDKSFKILNLHLEAFDKQNRIEQARAVSEKAKKENIDLVTGDFNMLPASASKRSKFKNSKDEYENDSSYDELLKSGLLEVIPDEIYVQDESRYFTFPSTRPDRRIDYIWYRPSLKMMKAEILPSVLSDHLPLRATFQIDGPRFNPYAQ